MAKTSMLDRAILGIVVAGGALLTWLALVAAPSFAGRTGFTAPLSWKLFFFHVPVALTSFLAFGVAFYHSLFFLARPEAAHDHGARAAVEVGVVFSALTLATGMIWGQAEWGEPWRWWDAKLVLVLVMFLIYLAYLVLRREIDDPDKAARLGAVYAVAAFATVPLTWFAQRIWLSAHPEVFGGRQANAGVTTPGVMPIFLLALAVFAAVFLHLYRSRCRLLARAERLAGPPPREAAPA